MFLRNPFNFTKTVSKTLFHSSFPRFVRHPIAQCHTNLSKTFKPSFFKFPKENKKIVGYWYLAASIMVFGIVTVGGLTRLTESGLSITEWNIIKGIKPPTNAQDWDIEFDKYKKSPEYIKLNSSMTIDEFKNIFYWEWAHRMLGRAIGVFFVVPGCVFLAKGYMTKAIAKRSFVVSLLIGTQGLFGWYMVKSGLSPDLLKNNEVIIQTLFFLIVEILKIGSPCQSFMVISSSWICFCYLYNNVYYCFGNFG